MVVDKLLFLQFFDGGVVKDVFRPLPPGVVLLYLWDLHFIAIIVISNNNFSQLFGVCQVEKLDTHF